jgi:uncharacterized membrane protein HdeD (DUF308 family)
MPQKFENGQKTPRPDAVNRKPQWFRVLIVLGQPADTRRMNGFQWRAKPWLAVQVLGALVMVHASLLFLFADARREQQLLALAGLFFSMGLMGLAVSLAARRWLGSGAVAWSSGVKFFGGLALVAIAPADQRQLSVMAAMVLLVAGVTHLAGALRLRREEQRYRPFLLSGIVNLAISSLALIFDDPGTSLSLCALVAVATFGSGLALFHYGRLLRRMASTSDSLMEQIRNTPRVPIRHSKARI